MKKNFKLLIALSSFVLLAAACNSQPAKPKDPGLDDTNLEQSQNPATSTPEQPTITPHTGTQTKDNAGKPDYTPGFIVVSQSVEGSNLNQPYNKVKEATTAFDLLKTTHTLESKTFSGIGEMVTAIDGNKADSKHFWEFIVNGKSSNVGASSYTLKDGDKIEWKLDLIK